MQSKTVTAGPLATADADAILESSSPTAGAITMDGILVTGGVAVMDNPRRVLITSDGNDSTNTFTLAGTNWSGATIGEAITGPSSGTVQSVLDYKTVTSITISGNAVGAILIGTSAVGGSPWIRLDDFAPANTSLQCNVTGTVNYTVQSTLDDPNDPASPVNPEDLVWVSSSDTAVVGATTTRQSNFLFVPKYVRVLLNSGTGSVRFTALQASNGPA